MIVFFPDKNEFVPPGFVPVKRGKYACNINSGTSSERIFIAYKKDRLGNPLIDLQVIFPGKNEESPKSFCLIDKSPTGAPANLNTSTGGGRIYLCYKQKFTRLACLLNEPSADNAEWSPIIKSRNNRSSARLAGAEAIALTEAVLGNSSLTVDHSAEIESTISSEKKITENSPSPLKRVASDEVEDFENTRENDYFDEIEDDTQDFTMDELTLIVQRSKQLVVDSHGQLTSLFHRKLLYSILISLYMHNDRCTEISVNGLIALIKDTDFFHNDLTSLPEPNTITMLDVMIESICDKYDMCTESEHILLLNIIRVIIRYSSGKLSSISIQKLFQSFHYLCGYYSTRNSWMFIPPYKPINDNTNGSLVLKVFKEMVWATVAQIETVEVVNTLPDLVPYRDISSETSSPNDVVKSLLYDLVDDTTDSVEISRAIDAIVILVSKQSMPLSYIGFWEHCRILSRRLFSDSAYRTALIVLCGICKASWQVVRKAQDSDEPNARDLGSKLLALESLLEFCISAGEKMKRSKVMGYVIRRLVVPCLLHNLNHSFTDHRIFSKVFLIITTLWKVWRTHVRIEIAIFSEYLMTKILQANSVKIKPTYQMIVLQEVVTWFDQPYLLVEMFVNYDMDSKFVSHWNVFSYLTRAICALARRTSTKSGAWDWRPGTGSVDDPSLRKGNTIMTGELVSPVTARDVNMYALEEVSRIAKTLMDATGHAYLMIQDSSFRSRTLRDGSGWEEDYYEEDDEGIANGDISESSSVSTKKKTSKLQSVQFRRAVHEESEELINQAIKIYKEKDSVKKAVQFLISKNFMSDTPQEIASFLRVYKNHFDPTSIGDFLGEGGVSINEIEYWNQIRFRYIRAVTFIDLDLEPALRLLLTGCGFRLPGEAQKIDRIVEVFVKTFWQDNHGTSYCPFLHSDTIHLITYAMIMLNTDLHRANKNDKKSKVKKMTKEEFTRNLRGVEKGGGDIDKDYLGRIYDSIASHPIELPYEDKEINREGSHNTNGNSLSKLLTSSASMISEFVNPVDEKNFIRELTRGLKDAEDLLRSLSSFTYHFQSTGVDTNISLNLVSFMYETVWFHFHAITESLLTANENYLLSHMDINVLFAGLDILCYSLTSSIFLDLKVEKITFSNQLMKFIKLVLVNQPKSLSGSRANDSIDNSWFNEVETVTPQTAMETIAIIHKLIVNVKDSIQEIKNYEMTRTVAAKIEKKARVLENNTFFVREGDLTKKNRSGRLQPYRFFLFSDHLMYAHMTMSNEYKVHESLPLASMNVSGYQDDPAAFYVEHPTKSFIVIADSIASQEAWLRDLVMTISNCKKRVKAESQGPLSRRMSIIDRIEDQQMMHNDSMFKVSPEHHTKAIRNTIRSNSKKLSIDDGNLSGKDILELEEDDDVSDSSELAPLDLPKTPTAEEKLQLKLEAINTFNKKVLDLSNKQLDTLFNAGVRFWKDSRGGGSFTDEKRERLQQLFDHIKNITPVKSNNTSIDSDLNDLSITDNKTTTEQVFNELHEINNINEISSDDAKRYFLIELFQIASYWRYDQFI
eukprot:CAMPEP_0196764042 /NCGR_PEP_ID=MMETSP1095-20130614/5284_1 /TAXON_ID=96789 ORGANISM="Chromulina nebulosa, Strain UTEXLB2642" /NCGR_SAMPLE_ID=MMETSP1095 /ASSEMBLY_ACC=CAM_ASM_000446 /LENGTH=1536 /DNA_ID=CAMNT_0042118611 /DNA_START=710 /DNA_END=5320 /DNA_ORIENTATION=-